MSASPHEGQEELKDRASEDELEDQAGEAEGGEQSRSPYRSGVVPIDARLYKLHTDALMI